MGFYGRIRLKFGNAIRIFAREEPSDDYKVTIKTIMTYKPSIKHVDIGIA